MVSVGLFRNLVYLPPTIHLEDVSPSEQLSDDSSCWTPTPEDIGCPSNWVPSPWTCYDSHQVGRIYIRCKVL